MIVTGQGMASEQTEPTTLHVGTRRSKLALAQTRIVCDLISSADPGINFEVVTMNSSGDENPDTPLSSINATGFFTSNLEEALLTGSCDIVVHSLKDLPTVSDERLTVAAIPARADATDCIVTRGVRLTGNSSGAVVGTSSPRRSAAIRHYFPGAIVRDIRGNVDSRIAKVDHGDYDAVVLAVAGLERLGLTDRITEKLDLHMCTPAAGQGALAVQARADDEKTCSLLRTIDHRQTRIAVDAERFVSREMGADCQQALGVYARVTDNQVSISAMVWRDNGAFFTRAEASSKIQEWRETCREIVRQLRG